MDTWTYSVAANNFTAAYGVPCNAIDWRTCEKKSWFFWESSCVFNLINA